MDDEGAGVADIGEVREHLHVFDEIDAGVVAAFLDVAFERLGIGAGTGGESGGVSGGDNLSEQMVNRPGMIASHWQALYQTLVRLERLAAEGERTHAGARVQVDGVDLLGQEVDQHALADRGRARERRPG